MSIQFCPFFKQVVCLFDAELYELYICCILIPHQFYYLQISAPIQYVVFILSMISFPVQKLLCLIRSYLFIFAFISFVLGNRAKKILPWFISKSVLPMFYSRCFILSSLAFGSLIHFELTFVYSVRECSNLIVLHVAVQCSQQHLLKREVFSPLFILASCHRLIDH